MQNDNNGRTTRTGEPATRWAALPCLFVLGLTGHAAPPTPIVPDQIQGTTQVVAEDVYALAEARADLVIIDARLSEDRAEGYIEGSLSLPDTKTTCERLAEAIPAKDTPTLFYCNGIHCGRSVKAIEIAIGCGYTTIYWFRGGFAEWQAKGYPYLKN